MKISRPIPEASRYHVTRDGEVYREDPQGAVLLKPDAKGKVWITLDNGKRTARGYAALYAALWPEENPTFSEEDMAAAVALAERTSLRRAATIYGVSHGTIRNWRDRLQEKADDQN